VSPLLREENKQKGVEPVRLPVVAEKEPQCGGNFRGGKWGQERGIGSSRTGSDCCVISFIKLA
jgi:hypothetical protein